MVASKTLMYVIFYVRASIVVCDRKEKEGEREKKVIKKERKRKERARGVKR